MRHAKRKLPSHPPKKRSNKLTCPFLIKLNCCNDTKQFINLSKNMSSFIPYMNTNVTLNLTLFQRRVRRRETIGSHDPVTANKPLERA